MYLYSVKFNIFFITNFNDTWEISLKAGKKKETKGYKNTNIAPGMHCGYRGREREQQLKQYRLC